MADADARTPDRDAPDRDASEPARRSYSAEEKGHVLAALLAGQGVTEVAREYRIPEGTVKAWRARIAGSLNESAPVVAKREQIGDLLIDYLHETITTLTLQQKTFRDREWLKAQSAADLAVLHGVLTDKAIRLLEALGAAGPLPEPSAGPALPSGEPVAVIGAPS